MPNDMQSKFLCAGLFFLCSHAFAADVPKELIDMNIKACEQIKVSPLLDKDAYRPDAAHLTSFCTCSTETYFNKLLPEADWQEMKSNPMKYVPQQSDSQEVIRHQVNVNNG
jgi:hypothetical protein